MTVTRNDTTVEITGGALDTIARCSERLNQIRHWHGEDEYRRVSATYAHSINSLLLNAEWIGYDSDLSLISRWRGGLVVGMIFHRESVKTTCERSRPGSFELLGPSTTDDMVESGTWSTHS
jgi:hypothetical protein